MESDDYNKGYKDGLYKCFNPGGRWGFALNDYLKGYRAGLKKRELLAVINPYFDI